MDAVETARIPNNKPKLGEIGADFDVVDKIYPGAFCLTKVNGMATIFVAWYADQRNGSARTASDYISHPTFFFDLLLTGVQKLEEKAALPEQVL